MGFSFLLFLFPQVSFIWLAMLFTISFVVIFFGVKIIKIKREEILNSTGSLFRFIVSTWGINIAAFSCAIILTEIITANIPYLNVIHSEFIAYENITIQDDISIACLFGLHIVFLLLSYLLFKKTISDKSKRKKLFISFITISGGVWATLLFILFM